jgi:hypothetical protein
MANCFVSRCKGGDPGSPCDPSRGVVMPPAEKSWPLAVASSAWLPLDRPLRRPGRGPFRQSRHEEAQIQCPSEGARAFPLPAPSPAHEAVDVFRSELNPQGSPHRTDSLIAQVVVEVA